MAIEPVAAVSVNEFMGAKSTTDGQHVLLKCRNDSGEFHIAIRFDQVLPLISALSVEVELAQKKAVKNKGHIHGRYP